MKMNLYVLKEDLSEWEFEGVIADEPYIMKCDYPVLCNNCPDSFEENILYIIESNLLPDQPPETVGRTSLLCLGEPGANWKSGRFNIIYTKKNISSSLLLNQVTRIFFQYTQWEQSMQKILDENQPLSRLADISMPLIKNAIFAHGAAYNVIISQLPKTDHPTHAYQHYKSEFLTPENQPMRMTDINLLLSDPQHLQTSQATEPVMVSQDRYGLTQTLTYNVRVNGIHLAKICFDEILTPLTKRHFSLIKTFGFYLGKGLYAKGSYTFTRPIDLDETLQTLLEHHHLVPEARINSLLNNYGWKMQDTFICLILKLKTKDQSSSVLNPIASGLVPIMHNDCYTFFCGSIVYICNLTTMGKTRSQFLNSLLPVLRDNLLCAGISTLYNDFKNLYYFYKQAIAAYKLGERNNPTHWYFRYEQYQMEHILNQCIFQSIPDVMIPDGLKALMDHDKQNGTEHMKLLQTYLQHDRNIADTSRILYIHRNTFLYRMQRIEQIINMNLNDPEVRCILQIAFLLLERNKHTEENIS